MSSAGERYAHQIIPRFMHQKGKTVRVRTITDEQLFDLLNQAFSAGQAAGRTEIRTHYKLP